MATQSGLYIEPNWLKNGPPTLNSDEAKVKEYIARHMNPRSPRWRWNTQRAGLNLWFYLGRQWIETVAELAPSGGSYHFREVYRDSVAAFPRPVTNIIAPAVDNEVARLSRKEYVADTSAGKNAPAWMAAARLAKDIVTWEMTKQIWEAKREQTCFNLCIDAVVGIKTWWDENDTELTLIAAEDPRRCPSCGAVYASARVPVGFAEMGYPTPEGPMEMRHKETLAEVRQTGEATALHPQGIAQAEMRLCPMCDEPTNLEPYMVNEQEAMQKDPFGRPLGVMVPRGEGSIDPVGIHEYFPENGGIGKEPHEQTIFKHMHVETLEWCALRYPEIADELVAEDPHQLLRVHPLYSDRAFLGQRVGVHGPEVYSNHAMVKEVTVLPQPHIPGLEKGAIFTQICEGLVRKPLCVEVESDNGSYLVPRMKYHFARFKRIPKIFYSRSVVDDLIPINRRINEIDAQDVDLRERGKPMMWTPPGVELNFRDDVEGTMAIMEYDSSAVGGAWSPKDGLFPGGPLTGSSYHAERQQAFADAQLIGAAQDIEMGKAPGSVKTTSGLMLLSEEASQKRGPRERALVAMYESAFEHILQLNQAFRQEDQDYEVRSESGIFERKSYTGEDLCPGIKVKMNARASYDEVLYNKEATAEAIQMGLYKLDNAASVDRALENMRLPKNINQKNSRQITLAEMAWGDFLKTRKIPVIDPTIHDTAAWFAVLSTDWLEDEGYALQQSCDWDSVLLELANWPTKLQEEQAKDQMQKAVYGKLNPNEWAAKYAEGQQLRQQVLAAQEKTKQAHQDLISKLPPGEPAPPMDPQAPVPEIPEPPLDGFLPEDLGRRIYAVWRRMLPEFKAAMLALESAKANKAPISGDLEKAQTIDDLLQMKAVIEECRILSEASAAPPPAPGVAPGPAGPAPTPPPAGSPPAGGPAGPTNG